MAYADAEDLQNLSLSAAALRGVASEKIDAALEEASRRADGYLNVVYRMPITAHGSDLTKAVCDLAALTIMKARGYNPEVADADTFELAAKSAVKWLEGVAAGKIRPVGIVDSSEDQVNVEDSSGASHAPMVVQLREEVSESDDFWSGTSAGGSAGVGTPFRRGW